MPGHFSFIETFDLFYKIHRIFNLEYHKDIKTMMIYFGHFIYGFRNDEAITSEMHKIAKTMFP